MEQRTVGIGRASDGAWGRRQSVAHMTNARAMHTTAPVPVQIARGLPQSSLISPGPFPPSVLCYANLAPYIVSMDVACVYLYNHGQN